MKRTEVNELHFIRLIACMSVVMIHAITKVIYAQPITEEERVLYRTIHMLLMFATPMFVLISEFVAAHVYRDHIPKGFLWKRVKYIAIPYLVMATFYAGQLAYRSNWTFAEFREKALSNYMGEWHGYFVLIIFQFYLLHILFVKYLRNVKPIYILVPSFVISVSYWVWIHFYAVHPLLDSHYVSNTIAKIFFVGWLFYFVVAYYAGRNYRSFKAGIQRNRWWIALGTIVTLALVQYVYHTGILTRVGSARFDLVAYTVMVFLLLFYLASKIKRVPTWVVWASSFSYGIYLLHPFVQTMLVIQLRGVEMHFITYQMIHFVAGMVIPMVAMYFITRLPLGEYVVGKLTLPTLVKKTKEIESEEKRAVAS